MIFGVTPLAVLPLTSGPIGSLSPNVTLSQASSVGVARTLADQVTASSFGVAAIGAVGIIAANLVLPLSGAQGIGVARAPMLQVSVTAAAAPGIGVGRNETPNTSLSLSSAQGIGTVGAIAAASSTPLVISVAGIGTVGSLTANPGDSSISVAGIGRVGLLTVQISGGGGGEIIRREIRRDPRLKTGLEPVYRQPPERVVVAEPKLMPPPFKPRPIRPQVRVAPPSLVDQALIPHNLADIEKQIREAERISRAIQDENDIADVIRFLEQMGTS